MISFEVTTLAYVHALDICSILIKHWLTNVKAHVHYFYPHSWRSLTLPHCHCLSVLLRTADAWPEPRATLINAHGGSCTPAKAWAAFRLPRSLSFLFFLPVCTSSRRQSLGHWRGKWPCAAAIQHVSFLSKPLSIEAELLKRQICPFLHTSVMLSLFYSAVLMSTWTPFSRHRLPLHSAGSITQWAAPSLPLSLRCST